MIIFTAIHSTLAKINYLLVGRPRSTVALSLGLPSSSSSPSTATPCSLMLSYTALSAASLSCLPGCGTTVYECVKEQEAAVEGEGEEDGRPREGVLGERGRTTIR